MTSSWIKKLESKISKGLANEGRRLSKRAMGIMGHIVVAEDGWIVKKFKDGRIEKIEKI